MSKLDQLRAMRETDARTKSRGGRESRPANPSLAIASKSDGNITRQSDGVATNPASGSGRRSSDAAGVASGPRDHKPKGRPLDKDRHKALAATQPWKAEGMSRATWFRRKRRAEGKA